MRRHLAVVIAAATVGLSHLPTAAGDASTTTDYPFILMDRPARLSTMKQFDQNYLSAYRVVSRQLQSQLDYHYWPWIQMGLGLFTLPLTHEEGHRSVLTARGIGAISRPYPNASLAAYVSGVTDATLIELRDTDLPTFIRLHTAGLESDYALGNRCTALAAFEREKLSRIFFDCALRRLSHVFYYASSPIGALAPEIEEEDNELRRDIVGHDVYGAIRHLHRPTMPYYRYTDYEDLTAEERRFVRRVAVRSLLNLANPLLVLRRNFAVRPDAKISAGLGYSMGPFGDFLDENVWLLLCKQIRLHLYARQFQGQHSWFPAGGATLYDYPIGSSFWVSAGVHVWRQPAGLSFTSSDGVSGALADLEVKLKVLEFGTTTRPGHLTIDVGGTAKSTGFVPEEPYLGRKVGLQLGTTVTY